MTTFNFRLIAKRLTDLYEHEISVGLMPDDIDVFGIYMYDEAAANSGLNGDVEVDFIRKHVIHRNGDLVDFDALDFETSNNLWAVIDDKKGVEFSHICDTEIMMADPAFLSRSISIQRDLALYQSKGVSPKISVQAARLSARVAARTMAENKTVPEIINEAMSALPIAVLHKEGVWRAYQRELAPQIIPQLPLFSGIPEVARQSAPCAVEPTHEESAPMQDIEPDPGM